MSSEAWDVVGPQPQRSRPSTLEQGGDRQTRAFEAVTLERTDVAQRDFDGRWAARVEPPEVPWWEGPRPKCSEEGVLWQDFAWGKVYYDDSIYLETLPPTGSLPRWWNPERDGMSHVARQRDFDGRWAARVEPPEVPWWEGPRPVNPGGGIMEFGWGQVFADDSIYLETLPPDGGLPAWWNPERDAVDTRLAPVPPAPVPEVVLGEAHTIDWERGGCVECSEERRARLHQAMDNLRRDRDAFAEHQRHVEANLAFRRGSSHIDHGCGPECLDCTAKAEALGEVDRTRERLRDAGVVVTYPEDPLPGGEVRVVDPETGGAKGSKPARFDMIPADVLWELAEHYGKGEAKYPGDEETGQANWQRGYPWHLSVAALLRHLNAWLAGEDVDPETGSNHLIAVIWHAIALRYFQKHGLGRDDIWTRRSAA